MCNMRQAAMERAGETGECFASRSHLATVKCQAQIIATMRGELAAKEAECAEMAQQLADATEACDHMREAAARVKAAAPVAPVAGSAGDDMEFVMALNAYRYADIKGIVGRPHPLEVAFDALVAYLDSRPASAPRQEAQPAVQAVRVEVKEACYRVDWSSKEPAAALLMAAMKEEIADLRALLATPSQQPAASEVTK